MRTSAKPSHNYLFRCDACRFISDNKNDYNRHISSIKHAKRTASNANSVILLASEPDIAHHTNNILLENPKDYSTGEPTVQHAFIFDKRIYKYCDKCGHKYCSKSGLWKHRKTCEGIPVVSSTAASASASDQDLKVMMMDMLKNNQEFQHKIIEMLYNQQQTIAASVSAAASNNHYYAETINSNSNNSNNNNNTFNLQFFLNEHCKDAMNITDFASSIRLNITDLDEFGKMGYVKGMSKLFLDSLRKTELCKRPIHCSDARRETLYVKDADKWEREDSQNTKITNAVRVVEHKNIVLVNEWAKQNPKCEDSSTHENTQYINMSRAVLDGDDRNIAKVIKLVAKEVVIEK
jgi:hypothetical protein